MAPAVGAGRNQNTQVPFGKRGVVIDRNSKKHEGPTKRMKKRGPPFATADLDEPVLFSEKEKNRGSTLRADLDEETLAASTCRR